MSIDDMVPLEHDVLRIIYRDGGQATLEVDQAGHTQRLCMPSGTCLTEEVHLLAFQELLQAEMLEETAPRQYRLTTLGTTLGKRLAEGDGNV